MKEELIIEFFGAFLGFFSAALLSNLQERRAQKKKYKMVLDCLINELRDITRSIQKYIDARQELMTRIAIPTWDAIQYSGITLELISKPYFEDLIGTYALIKAYNEDLKDNATDKISRLEEIVESGQRTLKQVTTERLRSR